MIIAKNRQKVIHNIKERVSKQQFNQPVEIKDPNLSTTDSQKLLKDFWQRKVTILAKLKATIIRFIFYLITPFLTTNVQVKGTEKLSSVSSAFITCNHYNQLDVLPIKRLAMKFHKRLYFLVKDSNLLMPFPINTIVKNADTVPVNHDLHYLGKTLPSKMKQIFQKKQWILIYPEQEMWFNYRKPRPLQKGAYYYAAKLNQPVISCFVELQDKRAHETFHRDFFKTKLILHILEVIYPNPHKSVSENVKLMRERDFLNKKKCYEHVYSKKLNYNFSNNDVAGFDSNRKKK